MSPQAVDAELGIYLTKEVHVVGDHFEFDDLGSEFLRRLEQDFFQACADAAHEHWLAILGTPNDADSANPVVLAGVHEVVVTLE